MSFAPKIDFPGSNLLRPYCDEDCDCQPPSLGRQVLVAFVEGAAPVVMAYAISRLTQKMQDRLELVVDDEDDLDLLEDDE